MVAVGLVRFHIPYSRTYLLDVIHSYYIVHCSSVCNAVVTENMIYLGRCRQPQVSYQITFELICLRTGTNDGLF